MSFSARTAKEASPEHGRAAGVATGAGLILARLRRIKKIVTEGKIENYIVPPPLPDDELTVDTLVRFTLEEHALCTKVLDDLETELLRICAEEPTLPQPKET